MKLGSLFSGSGLGDLGWMMAGMDIRWQVEIDPYCQKVLDLRFPESKKYHDIKTLKGKELEPIEILAGGFPCQPFSLAGKQRGAEDNRDLWPQMLRVIRETKPRWVVGENVPGMLGIPVERLSSKVETRFLTRHQDYDIYEAFHFSEDAMYLNRICQELQKEGYEVLPLIFSAHSLGANHKRERLWIIAYSGSPKQRWLPPQSWKPEKTLPSGRISKNVGDTNSQRQQEQRFTKSVQEEFSGIEYGSQDVANSIGNRGIGGGAGSGQTSSWRPYTKIEGRNWWDSEPGVCRVVNVCPNRVDRLKALGNGQVVACTAFIGSIIMDFERLIEFKRIEP